MQHHGKLEQTIHPHPSLSEVIGEAALAVDGRAIHYEYSIFKRGDVYGGHDR